LVDVVEERVAHASAPEVRELLDYLEAHGRTRAHVLELAMTWMAEHGMAPEIRLWIASKLDSKTLWKGQGREVVRMFLESPTGESLNALLNVFLDSLMQPKRKEEVAPKKEKPSRKVRPPAPFISVIHEALAAELIALADRSVRAGHMDMAERALRGLANLSPPSRLYESVRRLRNLPGVESLTVLIEANERLIRRADTLDSADFDALGLALHALLVREDAEEEAS
jgi:hypothetical protein